MRSRILLASLAAAFAVWPVYARPSCESLLTLAPSGVSITLAAAVPAGPFQVGTTIFNMPAFCRVVGVVKPEVGFELWMPLQWNRKLLAVGNGGLAGSVNVSGMINPLRRGYAATSTDTGHVGNQNDASWAMGRHDRVVNFADRAIHLMVEADKAILRAFYQTGPSHSYFSGCSQGGHEALIEAQRYPRDFDGIIAGDPANNWTHHYAGGHIWTALVTDGDNYIPASKVPIIAEAVNKACDSLDGIKDGILNDPRRCHFDPSVVQCKGQDQPTCLTAPQVRALRRLYTGPRDENGDQIYPGYFPGGEIGPGGWTNWITGSGPGRSSHATLGISFFRYIVFENPEWDFRTFRFESARGVESDVDYIDAKLGTIFNATDPDLSTFRAEGGKLIQYHGWSDPDIPPLSSIHYYENVIRAMGRTNNHRVRDTRDFYRLFMVPGMQHCSGGPGPSRFDALTALEQWAEHDTPPEKIIAVHLNEKGAMDMSRPLCPYPQEAKWKGKGSTDDAANFVCALPDHP